MSSESPAASTAPAAVDIFDRARAAAAARPLPPFIAFTQEAIFERRGRSRVAHERVILRLADGRANIVSLDDPQAAPRIAARPLIFPTTTFGLAPRAAGEQPSSFEPSPRPPDGPSVIGRVRATSRAYDVSLAGIRTLDGAEVFHLTTAPRFDPQHNRIRSIDVDTRSYEPRRIAIEYFAARGPFRSRPTVVFDYAQVGGHWVIVHGALDFTVRLGPFAYGGSGELRIYEVSFPSAEPDALFDSPGPPAALPTETAVPQPPQPPRPSRSTH